MLGERLKRFRIARGMSLKEFEAAIDRLVSSSTLSKYENGTLQPSAKTLNGIASAIGIKSAQLWSDSPYHIDSIAYRKRSKLGKREQRRIEAFVAEEVENRLWLQEHLPETDSIELPLRGIRINNLSDTETAANTFRDTLNLGSDPIGNLIGVLEGHGIYIVEVEASEHFDGISVIVRDDNQMVIAASMAIREGISGDRQRLNITHELGHLILDINKKVDSEKAAFRFGAAFLAPAEQLRRDVGTNRSNLQIEELCYLKKRYGISIQAILYRLKDLDIISETYYKKWCVHISKKGWKKNEPIEIQPEKPERFQQQIRYAFSEGLITQQDVERLRNQTDPNSSDRLHNHRREFLGLPKNKRYKIIRKQAKDMVGFYENDAEWHEWEGGPVE